MVERLLDPARRINRARNEIPQPVDRARLICARRYGDLVHTILDSLFRLCPRSEACLALRARLSLGNGRRPTHVKQRKTLAINPKGRRKKRGRVRALAVTLSRIFGQRPLLPAPAPPDPLEPDV